MALSLFNNISSRGMNNLSSFGTVPASAESKSSQTVTANKRNNFLALHDTTEANTEIENQDGLGGA